jgi:hypothetical protein
VGCIPCELDPPKPAGKTCRENLSRKPVDLAQDQARRADRRIGGKENENQGSGTKLRAAIFAKAA